MTKIRWYGPTLILLITVLLVLIGGPPLARQLAYEAEDARILRVREGLRSNPSLAELSEAFKDVARVVEKSVVSIEVYSKTARAGAGVGELPEDLRRYFFGPEGERKEEDSGQYEKYNVPKQYGNGSGWVYDDKGHIITNNHVVEDADRIVVRFYDGSERDAKIIGTDPKTDIAVIKVEEGRLHPAQRAKEQVDQGEIVFAFGSPFRFEFSMSQGIVSAKGRRLGILRGNQGYENFIQTDAAINPGNSGGPLTNIYGEVVGMNTAIATRTGSYNGLGFAIPVKMVDSVVTQLIDKGKVSRGYLGVYIEDLTPQMARTFGYDGKGVLVVNPIVGSPADKAGMQRGDIITKVNDENVSTAEELRRYVAGFQPGSKLTVEVYRLDDPSSNDGKMHTLTVEIGEQPTSMAAVPARGGAQDTPKSRAEAMLGKVGVTVQTNTKELAEKLSMEFTEGVMIEGVRPNSAAAAALLQPRMVITHVMGKPVKDVDDLVKELNKHDLAKGVRISVMDGDTPRFIFLELPE